MPVRITVTEPSAESAAPAMVIQVDFGAFKHGTFVYVDSTPAEVAHDLRDLAAKLEAHGKAPAVLPGQLALPLPASNT